GAQTSDETLGRDNVAAFFNNVPEDVIEIILSGFKPAQARHQYPRAFASATRRSRRLSNSSSSTWPPRSIDRLRVSRRAFNFASLSSTRRSPSRTTSLAEP